MTRPLLRATGLAALRSAVLAGILASAVHAQDRPASPVVVSEVIRRPLVEQIELVGVVHARRTSLVASQSEGQVVARPVEAGQRLRRGEPLLTLDNAVLRAALVEAVGDVELQRFRDTQSRELRAGDAISEDQALQARYELQRARSELADLEARISDLTVRAPFDGALVESQAEIGEWVSRGEAVARIVATDTMRAYVDVPEHHVALLGLGDEARVTLPALGAQDRAARIVAVLQAGRADSRTFPVVVEFLNPDGAVRAGMSAQVTLAVDHGGEGLLVHKDALVSSPRGTVIYVARDGAAVARPVVTGLAFESNVAVRGDSLQAGDEAIVRGNERLRPGQPVRVIRKLH